jgi:hypothetical protein
MFNFFRNSFVTEQQVEVWEILVFKDSIPDAEKRFGKPIVFIIGDEENTGWHRIGKLVNILLSDEKNEIFLTCYNGLTESEKRQLYREIQLLLGGKDVFEGLGEEESGWFFNDRLKHSLL